MIHTTRETDNITTLADRYARLRRLADRVRRKGSRTLGSLKLVQAEKNAAAALLDCVADAFGSEVPERLLSADYLGGFRQ